jgi:hypothetical protein
MNPVAIRCDSNACSGRKKALNVHDDQGMPHHRHALHRQHFEEFIQRANFASASRVPSSRAAAAYAGLLPTHDPQNTLMP